MTPLPDVLEPTRDLRATLPDLVEALLNKGVVLHLDLLIAVADVPLIGVSLRAAIAGIETMLEHGMLREWDAQTRAWVEQSIARDLPLEPGESVVARMPGAYEEQRPEPLSRPGTVYLTTSRLLVFRRQPAALLWHAPLGAIRRAWVGMEPVAGGGKAPRVHLAMDDGRVEQVAAQDPDRLATLLARHTGRAVGKGQASAQG